MAALFTTAKFVLQCLVLLLAMQALTVRADNLQSELKMALTYNFARYIQWPDLHRQTQFKVCIADDRELVDVFSRLATRTLDDLPIAVAAVHEQSELRECEVILINGEDPRDIVRIIEAVKDYPVLTISESPGFIEQGGIIKLYQERGKYRFQINPYAAQRKQLQISARLLQLATIVGR